MKIILIILLSCLFLNKIDPLQIRGLKNEYRQSEKIEYCIYNTDEKPIFINVALEAYLNDKWQEISIDITKKTIKAAFIYEIKHGNCKSFIYNLNEIDKVLFKKKQIEIRLKVYYQNKINSSKNIYHSDKITVKSV